jgi:cytochrome P450
MAAGKAVEPEHAGTPVPTCPFDHHSLRNPDEIWDAYERLRGTGVVNSDRHGGFYVLSRFDDVRSALRDSETFSSAGGSFIPAVGSERLIPINVDPPMHEEYRKLFSDRMTVGAIRDMTPLLDEIVDDLVTRFVARGGGDFMKEVALPLPLTVLKTLVGFSDETVSRLRMLTEESWEDVTTKSMDDARAGLYEMVRHELARHRETRPDDYMTQLIDAQVDGRPVRDDELVRVLTTFAVAGHETTANTAGWVVHYLAEHRPLQEEVRRDRSLIPRVVEEILRLHTPAQNTVRLTTRNAEVGEKVIPAEELVLVSCASANRDERQYANASSFDLQRGARGHLAFGFGRHQCPGASLARTELRLLLARLCDAPVFVPDGEPTTQGLLGGVHFGLRQLPVTFLPEED